MADLRRTNKNITNIDELYETSEYGVYLKEILSFFVPLTLQIPQLRDNPEFMRESIKAVGIKGITDVATKVDLYVQNQLKKNVEELHPEWQFWGEEGEDNTEKYDATKEFLFITDPIEGTNNFRYKKDELWGSVVALIKIKTEEPIIGIVAHPTKKRFYIGVRDNGVFILEYSDDLNLISFRKMLGKPKKEFTYNNSVHFSEKLQQQTKRFISLGEVKPFPKSADKLDKTRYKVEIKDGKNIYTFLNLECGALELTYRGIIMFKTSNETAALFVMFNELGGKITDGNGASWKLGINSLVAARNKEDYKFLKKLYDKTLY